MHYQGGIIVSKENSPYCLFKTVKKRVVWEVTHRCNYACLHCCSRSGSCMPYELNTRSMLNVLKELSNDGVEEIYFSGGEPFIREDMMEILQETRKKGILANISTNGSFMSEELAAKLRAIDVNLIHISLDSHHESLYNSFRGGNYFSSTISAIKNAKEAGLYVRVGAVIWKENCDQLEEMITFLADMNVDEVVFNWLISVGRFQEHQEQGVPLSEFQRLISTVRLYQKKYNGKIKISMHRSKEYVSDDSTCRAGDQILFILPDGRISPCSWLAKLDNTLITTGSLKDHSLKDLKKTDAFDKWQSIISKRSEICHSGCPAICYERNGSYFTEDPLLLSTDK